MSNVIIVFLVIFYYSKLSISKPVSFTNQQGVSTTTTYPIVLQIPPPPRFLEATTIVQYGKDINSLQTKLKSLDYSKDKSLIAVILPIRTKTESFVFNIHQPLVIQSVLPVDSS
jgi:hypothetical protein